MGTRATTRIQEYDDYIELYTRWDGFIPDIKESITESINQWQTFIDLFKANLLTDAPYTVHLREWITNFQNYFNSHLNRPTISTTAFLLSSKSFSHHHPLPSKADDTLNNYWKKNQPSLITEINNGNIYFKENIHVLPETVELKNIDTYQILRIKMMPTSENHEETYIDVKFKNITINDLIKEILLIPIFWRDFYMVYKNIIKNMNDEDFYMPAISSLVNKFDSFYCATSKYRMGYSNKPDIEFLPEEKNIEMKSILNSIIRMAPLDLYVNSLATQIAFILPDKVEFLTKQEENSVKDPDLVVYLEGNRLSKIFLDIPEDDPIIEDILSKLLDRETSFNSYYNVESSCPYQIIKNQNNNYIGIPFEENLVYIMESQRDIELKELKSQ
jgi:hypothetical protein